MKTKPQPEIHSITDLGVILAKDATLRRALVRESHLGFFTTYFSHHITYGFAPMHRQMFEATEAGHPFAGVVAFRGSAKTTIFSLSYPIWAILGKKHCQHVLILSQTMVQAKQHMANLKAELEGNELLRRDLGPFEDAGEQWAAESIILPKFGARVTIASAESSIRGIKHRSHRPDLIILDDVEDFDSTRTYEAREKLYQWFASEVVPAGDSGTQIIAVGNFLHQHSLLMRLKEEVECGDRRGIFLVFPLIDDEAAPLWPAKFKTAESIKELRQMVGSEAAFEREYLLRAVARDDQIIKPDWINYYDDLTAATEGLLFQGVSIGVDLAASLEKSADCTAIVVADVYRTENGTVYRFVRPNPINARMEYPQQKRALKELIREEVSEKELVYVFIEDIGLQKWLIQDLQNEYFDVKGTGFGRLTKADRLIACSPVIQNGQILFPREGCEQLIGQILGLGQEKHDDLADAFTAMTLGDVPRAFCAETDLFFG